MNVILSLKNDFRYNKKTSNISLWFALPQLMQAYKLLDENFELTDSNNCSFLCDKIWFYTCEYFNAASSLVQNDRMLLFWQFASCTSTRKMMTQPIF